MSPTSSLATTMAPADRSTWRTLTPLASTSPPVAASTRRGWAAWTCAAARPIAPVSMLPYRYIGFDTAIDQFAPQVNNAAAGRPPAPCRACTAAELHRAPHHNARRQRQLRGGADRRRAGSRLTADRRDQPGSPRHRGTTAGRPGARPAVADRHLHRRGGRAAGPQLPRAGHWRRGAMTTVWNAYLQYAHGHSSTAARSPPLGRRVTARTVVARRPPRRSDVLPNVVPWWSTPRAPWLPLRQLLDQLQPGRRGAEDVAGRRNVFDATPASTSETGLKYDLAGRVRRSRLSVFRTRIRNGLVQSGPDDLNPNGNRYFVEAGTSAAAKAWSSAPTCTPMRAPRG